MVVHASLEQWGSVWAYRSAYNIHMVCTLAIIVSQGLLIALDISTVRLAVLTSAVNVPLLFIRHHLQSWDDGEAAQRVGAPLQVAYTLFKPSLLLGLAFYFVGLDAIPVLTPDIVRVAESASPMLLMIDGFVFASLGLSKRNLVASVLALEGCVLSGAIFAHLPAGPDSPEVKMSTLGLFMGSLGLAFGAFIGHNYTRALVDAAAQGEWRRLQEVAKASEESFSRDSAGPPGTGVQKKNSREETMPVHSSRTSRSNSGNTTGGSHDMPLQLAGAGSGNESTSDTQRRLSGGSQGGTPAAIPQAMPTVEFLNNADETSTISDFMAGSDAVSVVSSTASTNTNSTNSRISRWEAARQEERRAEAAAELESSILAQIART